MAGNARQPETHATVVRTAERFSAGWILPSTMSVRWGACKPLAELSPDEWRDTLDSNLTTTFLGVRSQIPAMLRRGGGALVFTSSFVGSSVALPNLSAYGTAKAALCALVKGITADYAAQGIRANAVLAGGTDTDMAGNAEQKAWAAGLHAVKRIAQPEEIASVIAFLASPAAGFVTGASLFADGGNSSVK